MAHLAKTRRSRRTEGPPKRPMSLGNKIGLGLVALFFVAMIVGVWTGEIGKPRRGYAPLSSTGTARTPAQVPASTAAGTPWEYDAANNRYWDPRPGHQHWHTGAPPPESQRTAPAPGD